MPLVGRPMLSSMPRAPRRDLVTNDAFNLIGQGSCRFDPGAGLGAQMQPELARVDRWEEVLAELRNERETRKQNRRKQAAKHGAPGTD